LLADEVAGVGLDHPAEAGLVGVGIRRDVTRPVEVAFLQPAALDGAIAGIGDAVFLAVLPQCVVDVEGELSGDVELVAELADITDADGEGAGEADLDVAAIRK
jgi:hypothetical protein